MNQNGFEEPVLIDLPKYFKLQFSVILHSEPAQTGDWRNILHGL